MLCFLLCRLGNHYSPHRACRLHCCGGWPRRSKSSLLLHHLARQFPGIALLIDHHLAIENNIRQTSGVLVGVLECRTLSDRVGIEDDEVCIHPRTHDSLLPESELLRRERGHLAYSLFERQQALLTDIHAEN